MFNRTKPLKMSFYNKQKRDSWIKDREREGYVVTKFAYNRDYPDSWDIEMEYNNNK